MLILRGEVNLPDCEIGLVLLGGVEDRVPPLLAGPQLGDRLGQLGGGRRHRRQVTAVRVGRGIACNIWINDTSVADPGCLSRIPDPKTATKVRGEKKFVVIPYLFM